MRLDSHELCKSPINHDYFDSFSEYNTLRHEAYRYTSVLGSNGWMLGSRL